MFIYKRTKYYKYDSAKTTKWRKDNLFFFFSKYGAGTIRYSYTKNKKGNKEKITLINTFHHLKN